MNNIIIYNNNNISKQYLINYMTYASRNFDATSST